MKNDIKAINNKIIKVAGVFMMFSMLSVGMVTLLDSNKPAGSRLIHDATLGNKLNESGWMVYGYAGCGGCIAQQNILGDQILGLTVHDCKASKENNDVCKAQGIEIVPTWHNVYTNETILGVLQIEQLKEMAL